MRRFANQALGKTPHIAVLSSSKVGNFVVLTPLLRGLKEKYSTCVVDFFGSDTTADFERHCPHIDARFSLYSSRNADFEALAKFVSTRTELAGAYELAVNCDEFSELNAEIAATLGPRYMAGAAFDPGIASNLAHGGDPVQSMLADDDWNSPAFLKRHCDSLSTNYIGEIFCRLTYLKTEHFRLELPTADVDFQVPEILVHVTSTRSAKLWPMEYWRRVIDWCADRDLSVGLVGSAPNRRQALYHGHDLEAGLLRATTVVDLRGRTSLIELAGAMKRARACISVDAGPLHVAAAVGCPTVAVFGNDEDGDGASPVHLWAPRLDHVRLVHSTHKCTLCAGNHFKNENCLVDGHPCMQNLRPQDVIDTLQKLLKRDFL